MRIEFKERMNSEHYNIEVGNNFLEYNFYSDGPNGTIKKVVRFTEVRTAQFTYYNLAFGDCYGSDDMIDDFTISNNRDVEKVLATVAATVIEFANGNPGVLIYAEGSTLSRTRRYQMAINKYLKEIEVLFDIFGFIEYEGFMPFKPGRNYTAFMVRRKLVTL